MTHQCNMITTFSACVKVVGLCLYLCVYLSATLSLQPSAVKVFQLQYRRFLGDTLECLNWADCWIKASLPKKSEHLSHDSIPTLHSAVWPHGMISTYGSIGIGNIVNHYLFKQFKCLVSNVWSVWLNEQVAIFFTSIIISVVDSWPMSLVYYSYVG